MTLHEFYKSGDTYQSRQRSTPRRLLSNAMHLYALRLREQPLLEVLAVIGIAAGVALLFAVQVSSSSMVGAVEEIARTVSGKATLEVAARGTSGLDQQLVRRVEKIGSVEAAAPILTKRVTLEGQQSTRSVMLIGVDDRLEEMNGSLVQQFRTQRGELGLMGLHLAATTSSSLGVDIGDRLTVDSDGRHRDVLLSGVMDRDSIGAAAGSPLAVAPLGQVQRITGTQGRITRILVAPQPGSEAKAIAQLEQALGDRFDVRPSDTEVTLLSEALTSDRQSSSMFSAIAVVIGVLFAYNAMILGAVRRRRHVALLRLIGAERTTVLATLTFEAIALGLVASLIGMFLGDLVSRFAFEPLPGFISSGFPIGTERVVGLSAFAVALTGGLVAALLASVKPAMELFKVNPGESLGDNRNVDSGGESFGSAVLFVGLAVLLGTSIALFVEPQLTPVAIPALIVGIVLMLGPMLSAALVSARRLGGRRGGVELTMAIDELVGNRWRTTALGVIVVGALTATLSIGGASMDLERGGYRLDREFFETGDIWVLPKHESNLYLTESFDGEQLLNRIAGLEGVRATDSVFGAFLDVGTRRMRVVARSSNVADPLATTQIIRGDPAKANVRILSGGWVAVSDVLARDVGADVGDEIELPTPTGLHHYRLAATTSNYSWPSGVIVMNPDDFKSAWKTNQLGAIAVDLSPSADSAQTTLALKNEIGANSALQLSTALEMIGERERAMGQSLAKVRQISVLVIITSVLAIVASMFAAVWQRRERLAALRTIGMYRRELFRTLLFETTLVVTLSGLVGVALGIYCQYFASRWTQIASGYQSPFEPAIELALLVFLQVIILTLLATTGPALLASRVSPRPQPSA